jgi:hypothetical protein
MGGAPMDGALASLKSALGRPNAASATARWRPAPLIA